MAEKKKTTNWWWPKITDQATAIEASKGGFWAAVFVASITTIVATIALATQKEIASINAWAYLDALLFSIVAWRIKNYSKFFAVGGALLFVYEKVMLAQTQGASGWPLALLLLLMFINGARGVFAYHRYSKNEPQVKSV
jgi:hypothetical protein